MLVASLQMFVQAGGYLLHHFKMRAGIILLAVAICVAVMLDTADGKLTQLTFEFT